MNKIILHSQNQLVFINRSDIVYCKSDNCYTIYHLANHEEHIVCKSLKKTQDELDSFTFIRISQSYIINRDFIKLIDKKKKFLKMAGDEQLPYTISLSSLVNLIGFND
ncbi:LytR/AlgR family response regulator transcription factor [Pedobacter metabolipauper]|uniref:Two-component system LytT family response regulator n=1 Tax=Pedobacter metabolipauper TaxID=425513 RepID=A0A4R6STK5_9SPHI|nr:two-component system LytT family response regulator [Pedobacter metabolipauper]